MPFDGGHAEPWAALCHTALAESLKEVSDILASLGPWGAESRDDSCRN